MAGDGPVDELVINDETVEDEHLVTDNVLVEVESSTVEKEPFSEEEQRLTLYNALAENMPLVEEAIEGVTTFREALDEIVYELGHPEEESEGITQFTEYFTALTLLTGVTTVNTKGLMDVINHHVNNSKGIKRLLKKITIGGGILFGGELGAGFVIEKWYPKIAYLLKLAGGSGLATTGAVRGGYCVKHWLAKNKANKRFAHLYELADTLDAEVAELRSLSYLPTEE